MNAHAIEHGGHQLSRRIRNFGKGGLPPNERWIEIGLPDGLGTVRYRERYHGEAYGVLSEGGTGICVCRRHYEALRYIHDLAVLEIERRMAAK